MKADTAPTLISCMKEALIANGMIVLPSADIHPASSHARTQGFLRYLKHAKIPVSEFVFPSNKIANVQSQLEKLIEKNYYLHKSAKDAYRSYLQAYASHSHKVRTAARRLFTRMRPV